MVFLFKFVIGLITHFSLNFFSKKYKFLIDDTEFSDHKKLTNIQNLSLTGGITVLILLTLFIEGYLVLKLFSMMIFLVGLLSDLKIVNSPSLRFIFQAVIITFYILLFKNNIISVDLRYLDFFLSNNYFSIFFTALCFLILINGTNFIDGLNGLVIFYNILILIILLIANDVNNLIVDVNFLSNFLLILFICLIFNLLNKNFLGDSGSYIISFLVGSLLIDIYSKNQEISSLFIVLLLWYPAFEILFSIVRKLINNKNPLTPDENHLHQKIFLKIKNFFSTKIAANLTTSFAINLYNLLIFCISLYFINNSYTLLLLILLNISIYLFAYIKLKK